MIVYTSKYTYEIDLCFQQLFAISDLDNEMFNITINKLVNKYFSRIFNKNN